MKSGSSTKFKIIAVYVLNGTFGDKIKQLHLGLIAQEISKHNLC